MRAIAFQQLIPDSGISFWKSTTLTSVQIQVTWVRTISFHVWVKLGVAHLKQLYYVKDLLALLEQWAVHTTQLMCESHIELVINSTYN